MNWLKLIRIIGIILWSTCSILLILVLVTKIAFTNHIYYPVFIFTTTSGLPLILLLTTIETKQKRDLLIWFLSLAASTAIIYNSRGIIYFGDGYKTQTITHRNNKNPEECIAFQMEDIGALGYKRRTIIVTPVCCFLQVEQEINPDSFNYSKWKQVDEEINELGLKGG